MVSPDAQWSDLRALQLDRPSVVTIGSFDGVHRGHQHLIRAAVQDAREHGYLAVVVTFHPHPRTVLRPDQPFCALTTLDERSRLIKQLGADIVAVVPFTLETAQTTAEDFVRQLTHHLHMRALWVGPGFALGHRRLGTVPVLRALGERHGFTVHEVPAITAAGPSSAENISSSRIRQCLCEGAVGEARRLLGRPFAVSGIVVSGAGRGRQLGIPTANLDLPGKPCLPADGIYAVHVSLDGQPTRLRGAASLGTRPMFDNGARVLEIYILDFDADIYGHQLRVEFVERLRGEERFPSLEAFLEQVQRDIAETRRVLAETEQASAETPPGSGSGAT